MSKKRGVSFRTYEYLWEFNAGAEQVRRAMKKLGRQKIFEGAELDRFSGLMEEARRSTLSYLVGAIENAETGEAGRLYGIRMRRERRES